MYIDVISGRISMQRYGSLSRWPWLWNHVRHVGNTALLQADAVAACRYTLQEYRERLLREVPCRSKREK